MFWSEAKQRWIARLVTSTGRRRTFYGKSRAEAARKLATAKRELAAGALGEPSRQTVAAYLDNWLKHKKSEIEGASYREYETAVRRHLKPQLGHLLLSRLSPAHVQKLYTDLLESLAASSVHKIHNGVLYPALDQAAKWGLVARNVAGLVNLPKAGPVQHHVFTPDETRRFIAAIQGDRLEALYVLAITTGLRQGELLGLRWADLDLGRAILSVNQQWKRGQTGRLMGAPMTRAGARTVLLAEPAVVALRSRRKAAAEERLRAGPAWEDQDLVFSNYVGRPLNPSHLRNQLYYPLLDGAGLPRLKFHELRHSAATFLIARGVPLAIVRRILGHSNIAMTLVYEHVGVEVQEDAARLMGELFKER